MNKLVTTMGKVLSLMLVATLMLFTFNSPAYAGEINMACNSDSPTYTLEANDPNGYTWLNNCQGQTTLKVSVVPDQRWNYGDVPPFNRMVPATGNTNPPPANDTFAAPNCRPAELVLLISDDGVQAGAYCYHMSQKIPLAYNQTVRLVNNDSYYPDNSGYQFISLSNSTLGGFDEKED